MAVVPLLVALEDVSARVRTVAATGLGLTGDERAVEPLLAILQDQADDSNVRTQAAWALGKLRDERTFEVLLAALQDTHENVRGAAVYALSQFADERVFALLLAALQDSSSHVRRAAASGLGDLGDRRAIEPLGALLQYKDKYEETTVEVLGKLGGERVADLLIPVLQDASRSKFGARRRCACAGPVTRPSCR